MTKDFVDLIMFWNVALLNAAFMATHNDRSFDNPMFVVNFVLTSLFVFLGLWQGATVKGKLDD